MAKYFYTAKSFDGETEAGVLEARDERQLAQLLKNQGLLLIRTAGSEAKPGVLSMEIPLPFSRVSLAEKIMITRNLWVMVSSGLSLVKSFEILAGQAKKKQLKDALLDIRESISKGATVADSLEKHPDIFSEFFVNMVRLGEESGTLAEVFEMISLQLTKEHELASKMQNAMIYPCIILGVMLIVGGVIVTFVLPNLEAFFSTMHANIPAYTQFMLDVGDFSKTHWYLLLLIPVVLVAAIWAFLKTPFGHRTFDMLSIKIPVVSAMVKKNNSAFLIRSLSSLTASGIPLVHSLEIASRITNNTFFKEALLEAAKRVKRGEKLSEALAVHQSIFPLGIIEMIQVGEETGKTSSILRRLADFYEQEAIAAVERMSLIMEPALIVVLGLVVAFLAISIIQPLYSSLDSIAT